MRTVELHQLLAPFGGLVFGGLLGLLQLHIGAGNPAAGAESLGEKKSRWVDSPRPLMKKMRNEGFHAPRNVLLDQLSCTARSSTVVQEGPRRRSDLERKKKCKEKK